MLNNIISFALKNRVFIIASALLISFYGAYTALRMPIDVLPDLNRPTVTIMAEAHAMVPEDVERLVTIPVEQALNGATGVTRVRSASGLGLSVIQVEFGWETDIFRNRQIVQEKLQLVQARLPKEVDLAMAPIASIMGQIQLVGVASKSGKTDVSEVRAMSDRTIKPRLMSIAGVAQVVSSGGAPRQLQITVDADKLRIYDVTLPEVVEAIKSSNINASGGFPDAQAQLFASFGYTPTLTNANGGGYTMTIVMATHGLFAGDKALPDKNINLTQTNPNLAWSKDEGEMADLGSTQISVDTVSTCNITSNGEQPKSGVHAVILTKPAPCDFRLPKVTVSGGVAVADAKAPISVPIGTYWLTPPPCGETPGCVAAHKLPLVDRPAGAPGLDNGFVLIQPDGNSFLLVDAGIAEQPGYPGFQDLDTIANQVSQTLGFGATKVQQPKPGAADKGFSDGTLFKKGSVIAIYDDTPDMGGVIDVEALVKDSTNVLPAGLSLKWTAAVTSH